MLLFGIIDTKMENVLKKQSMSNDEFLNFIEYINACVGISDEDYNEELWTSDKGWEDEAAKFYGYNLDDIEDDDSLPL